MNWISWDVATGLVGLVSGLIFFLDGWRRSPKEIVSFRQTPRITGLAWLLGGGVINSLFTYIASEQQSRAMMVYVILFCLTLVVCLLLATISAVVYYVLKYYRQKPTRLALTEAIPFSLFS